MKKLVLTMIAMVTMSLSAMAQDTAQVRRQFNPEQMAKMRTDAVVQKYGLNEDQAKKLLDLNTRFADKIRPMGQMGGQRRGQGPRMQGGDRPQRMNPDSLRAQGQRRGQGGQGQRGGFNREEMQKNMEAYNNELKAILTPEQYEAYQKDEQQNRRQFNGPRMGRPTQRQ